MQENINMAILDAATLGSDISLAGLGKFGYLSIFDNTLPREVADRIKGYQVVITNKVIMGRDTMESSPDLKLICVAATGTNNIDLACAREKGIAVTNVAGYSTQSVVQHAFTILFALVGNVGFYDGYVKSGEYSKNGIFNCTAKPFCEIAGRRFGVIGLGAIGRGVAKAADAFGAEVVYYSTSGKNDNPDFRRMELVELLETSDFISIHAPLNDSTKNLITLEKLKMMKRTAYIMNLSRGGIINEADLAAAIDMKAIAGAAIDVYSVEPLPPDHPYLKVKNRERLLLTPHMAWTSIEARRRLVNEIILNIEYFLEGKSRNRVE